jgi:MFS family permease
MKSDAFAAMRVPAVRRYVSGRIFWALGASMLDVGVGWDIYQRTNWKLALGLVGLAQIIPVVLLALPAGAFTDRHNRKDVSAAAVALHLACGAALTVIGLTHAPTWTLYVVLVVVGVANAFGFPATGALLAQVTPPELYVNANAWRSMSFQLAASFGHALAGGVIAWSGTAASVYGIDVACVAVFLGAILSIPRPPTPAAKPHEPLGVELRAGLRFLLSTELLLSAITLDMLAVLLGGATALLPVFARDVLHAGADGLGWLRAAPALGALAMALVTTRLPPWQRAGRALLVTVVGFGAATIVFGLSRTFWLSWVALFFTGVFDNVSVVIRLTLEQVIVPEALRGRVGAVHSVFVGMSNEMGEFESGVTAQIFGPVLSVVGGGIGTILVVAWAAWKWPALRKLGRLADLAPLRSI